MHQIDGNCAFSNRGSYAFYIAIANIANRKYSGKTGFEHLRRTRERPCGRWNQSGGRIQIATGEDESFVVHRNAAAQPLRARGRSRHDEYVVNIVSRTLTGAAVTPGDALELSVAFQAGYFRPVMQFNRGIPGNPLNQIA